MDHQTATNALIAVFDRDPDSLRRALNTLAADDLWQLKRAAEELSSEAENVFFNPPRT